MKNLFTTLGLSALILLCTGTASFAKDDDKKSNNAKRVFLVSDFKSVSVSSGIDLYLQPSNKTEAIAYAPKGIMDQLVIERNGSKLVIRFKSGIRFNFGSNQSVKVYVSFKELESVSASGGSDIEMAKDSDVIKANKFNVNASGGTDVELNLEVDSLYCEASGGSDVELKGNANFARIKVSGGCDFKGTKFIVKDCEVHSSGGSDVYVHVTEKINASASGASDIYYYGNPKHKYVQKSGASDVQER